MHALTASNTIKFCSYAAIDDTEVQCIGHLTSIDERRECEDCASRLGTRLLLLLAVEGEKGDARDLDDLEADTRDVTDGVARATETGNQHLVVLIDVVEATVTRDEGGDLLAVLDELDTAALANGRVRLLGLNAAVVERQGRC